MRDSAEDGEGPIEEQPGLYYEDPAGPEDELYGETADADDEVYGDDVYDDLAAPDGPDGPDGEPVGRSRTAVAEPDVYLDVPLLKVDQIDLDVENLRAHVSLQAEVLDLLRLNVGADVALGRVHLGISGVEAQARLEVRLDNVAAIINRVLTTLDRNPQILEELTRGVGSAVRDVGSGARQAVGELGTGASRAVADLGSGAGSAVRDVGRGAGRGVEDVARGAGQAVEGVGRGAGSAVEGVGRGAGSAVEGVGRGAGSAVEGVGRGAAGAVGGVGRAAGSTVAGAAGGVTGAVETVPDAVAEASDAIEDAAAPAADAPGAVADAPDAVADAPGAVPDASDAARGVVRRSAAPRRTRARGPGDEFRDPAVPGRGGTRARRVRGEEGKSPPRPVRRRAPRERDEPP
ncbi:hypothetical protein ACIG54_12210 [Streptomyces achromogenes]|uniref:hypothetical protein n=1 Tax=Streptomyces achromogenes TaxID=67255 RepID=UPI0037D03442